MKLLLLLAVIAAINWWLSVPTPDPTPSDTKPEGSYAVDALIFALCLAGILYQRKQERERGE